MNSVAIEILFIALLVIANGIFAMSEMAVVSARKVRLQQRADEGDNGARAALELTNSPNQFLSTVQIGITLIGILSGALGGATIAEELATQLRRIRPLAPYGEAIGVAMVVVSITYLSLVVGELVPKRLALNNAEQIASVLAPLMQRLSQVTSPIVRLLSFSTEMVLRVFRVRPTTEPPVTKQDIKLMIKQGTQAGVFEPTEQEMVKEVFRLADRTINALMTPRSEVVWLDLNEPWEHIRAAITSSNHSCFPVARHSLDQVLGMVQVKDLLGQSLEGRPMDLNAVILPALFVPESMSVLDALERFKDTHSHTVLVIDEYGDLQGLVTVNDIMKSIVGDIPLPGEAAEPEVIRREDGSWLLDGLMPVDELQDLLQVELPKETRGYYQTLGGFVMTHLGHIPLVADHFEWKGFRFEVVDMDGRRVDKMLVVPWGAATRE